MYSLVKSIILLLKDIVSKELVVFIISLLPVFELRGGLVAAAILKIPYIKAAIICTIGNILPIPFILLFLNRIFNKMEKWNWSKKLVTFFRNRAHKNKSKINKYGILGLVLFVGIPLPGTGAWTGALVAAVFDMDIKKACVGILLGIVVALIIMSLISYGIISNIL